MDVTHIQEAGSEPAGAAHEAEPVEAESLVEQAHDFVGDVGELVSAHPVATLLTALGVGYAVGGGIFTKMTRRLLGTGLRLGMQFAVLPALEREVAEMIGGSPDATGSPPRGVSEP